ncbi:MAG: hypothetical protein IPF69_06690 [Chitinophagaceae bacterium]|nr:hypothetical protein [Chitinophagaceae bacterium]
MIVENNSKDEIGELATVFSQHGKDIKNYQSLTLAQEKEKALCWFRRITKCRKAEAGRTQQRNCANHLRDLEG